jgi:hypothetical protein
MVRRSNAIKHRRTRVNDDLFVKRVPQVIKELIAREAAQNHRSVNQEAIALLEEALLHRVEANHARRRSALATLASYAAEAKDEGPPRGGAPTPRRAPAEAGSGAN